MDLDDRSDHIDQPVHSQQTKDVELMLFSRLSNVVQHRRQWTNVK